MNSHTFNKYCCSTHRELTSQTVCDKRQTSELSPSPGPHHVVCHQSDRLTTGTRTRDQPTRVCIHSHKLSVVAIHRPHTNQMGVYAGHWSPSEKAVEHETQQSCTVRRFQSPEQRKDVSFIMRDQLSIKRLRSWASGQYSPYVPAQTHFVAVAAAEEIVT